MINIGIQDNKIKQLIKKKYDKNHIIVDDLFTLSLDKCKYSKIKFSLICEELIHDEETRKLAEFYKNTTECYAISKKVFERIASKGNLAGIIIYTKIEEIKIKEFENFCKILICDGIEISGNIGTIFRTAEATKIDAIIFTNLKAKVFDEKVIHSSRGMIFQVPFIILSFNDTINLLKKFNITPVVCEPEQGVDYRDFNYKNNMAYVVGSERFGCDKRWFEQTSIKFLKIPMDGIMDSLNVGVAASLIMYEVRYGKK